MILPCHQVTCNIPFIQGCIVQWYGTEPWPLTIAEPDDPTFIIPVSNEPSVAVAVCWAMSLLFQVTWELAVTVPGFGIKYVLTCCAAAPCGIVILLAETELGEDVEVEGGEEGICCCCCCCVLVWFCDASEVTYIAKSEASARAIPIPNMTCE